MSIFSWLKKDKEKVYSASERYDKIGQAKIIYDLALIDYKKSDECLEEERIYWDRTDDLEKTFKVGMPVLYLGCKFFVFSIYNNFDVGTGFIDFRMSRYSDEQLDDIISGSTIFLFETDKTNRVTIKRFLQDGKTQKVFIYYDKIKLLTVW